MPIAGGAVVQVRSSFAHKANHFAGTETPAWGLSGAGKCDRRSHCSGQARQRDSQWPRGLCRFPPVLSCTHPRGKLRLDLFLELTAGRPVCSAEKTHSWAFVELEQEFKQSSSRIWGFRRSSHPQAFRRGQRLEEFDFRSALPGRWSLAWRG